MKKKRFSGLLALALVVTLTACGGQGSKSTTSSSKEQTTQVESSALEVDKLLATADDLAEQTITVEGICTHICEHGGRKIFLMGSDDTKTIRVESGSMGAFSNDCVNSIVEVTGVLKEERIDEAYLVAWEATIAEDKVEQHGDGEAGCSTEKQARGEEGNTDAERIADFRKRIAEREASTGKAYLSFYFIEATNYEIQS